MTTTTPQPKVISLIVDKVPSKSTPHPRRFSRAQRVEKQRAEQQAKEKKKDVVENTDSLFRSVGDGISIDKL